MFREMRSAVPVSYVYCDSKLYLIGRSPPIPKGYTLRDTLWVYFHGAKSGHKVDAIKK